MPFEGEERNLKVNVLLDRESVELLEDRGEPSEVFGDA